MRQKDKELFDKYMKEYSYYDAAIMKTGFMSRKFETHAVLYVFIDDPRFDIMPLMTSVNPLREYKIYYRKKKETCSFNDLLIELPKKISSQILFHIELFTRIKFD